MTEQERKWILSELDKRDNSIKKLEYKLEVLINEKYNSVEKAFNSSIGINDSNRGNRDYIAMQVNKLNEISLAKIELTPEESLEIADLYPLWEESKAYKTGDIVKWKYDEDGFSMLWEVLQDHTSQPSWTPDTSASLFKRVGFDPESGYPIWVQPLGATDSYEIGEKVTHKEKNWESTVNANVWEPSVYGWEEI